MTCGLGLNWFSVLFFLFLNFSWRHLHFSNLQISTVLTIFLNRFDGTSQMRYDNLLFRKFIRFPDFFRIFPDFLQILRFLQLWPYFLTKLMVYFTHLIWYLFFRNIIQFPEYHPVTRFFRIFTDLPDLLDLKIF